MVSLWGRQSDGWGGREVGKNVYDWVVMFFKFLNYKILIDGMFTLTVQDVCWHTSERLNILQHLKILCSLWSCKWSLDSKMPISYLVSYLISSLILFLISFLISSLILSLVLSLILNLSHLLYCFSSHLLSYLSSHLLSYLLFRIWSYLLSRLVSLIYYCILCHLLSCLHFAQHGLCPSPVRRTDR